MSRTISSALVFSVLGNSFAGAQEFPDGPGKPIVTAVCGGCHDINRLRIGYTPEGWRTVIRMMQNVETPVPLEQWGTVTEYLTKNFPERSRHQGMAGPDPWLTAA
jgi:virginiamycin B lyase